jgi:gas vesicle protein
MKGQITNSKKGDFIIDVSGKTEQRIVIETKDMANLTLSKINQEIDEALENRGAKYGIFVAKWNEALPSSVGCFNYYNDDRIVCSLGSKEDELLHDEILQTAYCWARANILRKSASCEKVDFELIDNNLEQIKSQLDLFKTIRNSCTNINTASRKIEEVCEEIEDKIQQHLRNIRNEMQKGTEKELET